MRNKIVLNNGGRSMNLKLSEKGLKISPSLTLDITAKAKSMKAKGIDVVSFGAGEPDFNTPDNIVESGINAIKQGLTRYTPASGIIELKEAICQKFEKDNRLSYTPENIIISNGAKHSIYNALMAIINPNDEIIISVPYWVSYPELIKIAGGVPVYIKTKEENDFKYTINDLDNALTNKTKAIILNSPNNPTGTFYNEEELKEIADWAVKNNVLVISDEIYEKLVYTQEEHISIAALSNELKECTVVINGVSKSHAMTGWRIGYAAGPVDIIQAMTNHASHAISNPTSVAQYAALEAYRNQTENNHIFTEMKTVFAERLNLFYGLIQEIPGITCNKPSGAFYIFPNVKEAARINGFQHVDDWVTALLDEEKVALVPGSGFGAPDYVRLSYATSTELLIEAARRIKRFVEHH